MSREALQETLSAVMDNEADELELRRVLAACGEDAELRSTWSRYQLARSVMHREPTLPKLDIAAAVSAALADEAAPPKAEKGPWRMVGRLAVAASVTLAVLAGVRLYNQNDALPQMAQQGTTPQIALPQVKGPAVLAGYSEEQGAPQVITNSSSSDTRWHEQRLPIYLRQHVQQSAVSGTESALPYARAASLENRERLRTTSLLLLLGSLMAVPATQAADASDWLNRLAEADRQNSFQGTFVYERNGSFSTHEIWHRVESDGAVRERLLQLDGARQEVVRVDGRTQCISGGLADQLADAQLWPVRKFDPSQLASWYDLRLVGESRVAGRPAVVLAVTPRDQHRYGFELHLDRDTGLPLKSLLLNEKGQLLERFQFTQLNTGAAPAEDQLQAGAECQVVGPAKADGEKAVAWRSEWLPPGFTLTRSFMRRSPVTPDPVACLTYGDGLARFSVFIEPLHGAMVGDARSQLGPTVVVSKRLQTDDGGQMVTVVGEVPLGTAERVALSIRPEAAAQK